MNKNPNTHKWMTAANKVDRLDKLLRSELTKQGHQVSADGKIIDGAVVLLTLKADKDAHGDPSGKIRVVFGETGERQVIPIKDTEQNVESVVQAIGIFLTRKKTESERTAQELKTQELDEHLAKEFAKEFDGNYVSVFRNVRCELGKNAILHVQNEEVSLAIHGLTSDQARSLVNEIKSYGLIKESDQ
jgi:hypothetical protein